MSKKYKQWVYYMKDNLEAFGFGILFGILMIIGLL